MKIKVNTIIKDILKSKGIENCQDIKPESSLREDLGLTSFDLAELTVKLEDEFDIDIFEDGLVNTVGEIYSKLGK